jgi:hypothetical protein
LVESTTVQQLWAGVTTKKLILDIFSIRPNCQPRVSRSSRHTQVMLQTVTLFYIHCDHGQTATLLIHKNGSGAATRNYSETSNKHKMLRIEPRLAFINGALLANRVTST